MLTRIIAGLVGLPILVFFVISGDLILLAAIGLVALIGLWELYRAFCPRLLWVHWVGFGLAAGYFVRLAFWSIEDFGWSVLAMIMIMPILTMLPVVLMGKKRDIINPMVVVFGHLYIVVSLSSIYFLRVNFGSVYEVWLIFIAAWGCDTGAYFVGKAIGKRKLAPILSPKKTVAGAVGGTVVATLLGAAYGFILWNFDIVDMGEIGLFAAVTFACSLAAQLGDLAASAIKRERGVKDFGRLIPGHGGVLDRFDSIIFAAPTAFIIFWVIRSFSEVVP